MLIPLWRHWQSYTIPTLSILSYTHATIHLLSYTHATIHLRYIPEAPHCTVNALDWVLLCVVLSVSSSQYQSQSESRDGCEASQPRHGQGYQAISAKTNYTMNVFVCICTNTSLVYLVYVYIILHYTYTRLYYIKK